jgi:membrane-bound lytic murein transglycosylase D
MKQPLQKLRRFFSRTKKFNATANPDALSAAYDDDDGASRLSGAFVVVLLLHIVALVGVFAFARMKDSRSAERTASLSPAQPAALAPVTPKVTPPKQATAAATPGAPTDSAAPSHTAVATPAVTAAAVLRNELRPAAPEIPRASAKGVHVVKAGENLTKIANAHGVSVADLVKANHLKNEDDIIRAGQELKVPEPGKTVAKATPEPRKQTETATPAIYTVRKNDSLLKISSNLGVKYEDLVKLNNIKDPKKLQEGQKLKVPKRG